MAVESAANAPEEFVAPPETQEEIVPDLTQLQISAAVNNENRHPLQDSWSLWYLTCDKTKSWDDRLIKLGLAALHWLQIHFIELYSMFTNVSHVF